MLIKSIREHHLRLVWILYCIFICFKFITCESFAASACGIQEIEENSFDDERFVRKYEYPWRAALFKVDNFDGEIFLGSGTLINANTILTAAHLLNKKSGDGSLVKPNAIKVVLGNSNLNDTHEIGRLELSLAKIRINQFSESSSVAFNGDIAILSLSEDIIFSRYIRPICLPDQRVLSITTGETAGWCENVTDRAQKITLKIVNQPKCFKSAQKFLSTDLFCASVEYEEYSCSSASSGDGFYVQINSRFYLRGIASMIASTAKFANFETFTDVYIHLKFVMSVDRVDQFSKENLLKVNDDCGTSSQVPIGKVSKGDSFHHGLFPWMAALIKIEGNKQMFICGGTLVSARTVVTAAHCVHMKKEANGLKNTELLVLLGAHNLADPNEPEKRSMRVESIEIHPLWNAAVDGRFTGDIAILVLANNVTFTDYIKPICLTSNLPSSVQSGTVAGWGRQENQQFGTSNKLPKKIEIPIVKTNTCHDKTPSLAIGSWEESFCAGREGVSVCEGDSGSGFYVILKGRYYLKGIVSNSALQEDCVQGYHATFTDVTKYILFITSDNRTQHLPGGEGAQPGINNIDVWLPTAVILVGLLSTIIVFQVCRDNRYSAVTQANNASPNLSPVNSPTTYQMSFLLHNREASDTRLTPIINSIPSSSTAIGWAV